MTASNFMTIHDILTAGEKRKEIEENLRKARGQIQDNFDCIAEGVCSQMKKSAQSKTNEILDPQIKNAKELGSAIGDNIKTLRLNHGLSQAELVKVAGVSDKAVSTWK